MGLCCQPTHSTGSYYNSHFEERRCEIEQQQLRWNAALINLPPWSHWMCLPPPTQPSINRMLKGSVNALFWHGKWSSSKPTEYQKVTANVPVLCNCYILRPLETMKNLCAVNQTWGVCVEHVCGLLQGMTGCVPSCLRLNWLVAAGRREGSVITHYK